VFSENLRKNVRCWRTIFVLTRCYICFLNPFYSKKYPLQIIVLAWFISEVNVSDFYIGLLGKYYGYEDKEGISPTEHEYDKAKDENVQRWIFINSIEERHPKERIFITKIEGDVSRKIFSSWETLKAEVYNSCILFLKQNGFIDTHDFDSSINRDATLEDIDSELLREFVVLAKAKRNFPMKETDTADKILTALKMLRKGQLVNSAILAFCRRPQLFFPSATVKCAHFHGLKIEKPIPDYKEFGGTIFEMAEQAVNFVLSKISLSTGARDVSNRVDTHYEIPRRVVAEAIINAVAHRDYSSNSSVPHNSYPRNPILAESLFLTGDIERFGTGTLDMFELSSLQSLAEPLFITEEGVKITVW
jgi:ATP-dependent DNA helicase RecG